MNWIRDLLRSIFGPQTDDTEPDKEQPDEPEQEPTEPDPEPKEPEEPESEPEEPETPEEPKTPEEPTEDEPDEPDEPAPEPPLEAIELPEGGQGQTGHTNYCGVAIVPNEDLGGLEVRLGGGAKDITDLWVYDADQTVLERQKTTGVDAGDWVGVDYDFKASKEYRILLNGDGEEYVRYRAEASCPYEGDGLDVVSGSYSPGDESQTESYIYNIDRIRGSREGGVSEVDPAHRDIGLEWIASRSPNSSVAEDPMGGERSVVSVDFETGAPEDCDTNERVRLEEVIGYEPEIAHFRYQIYFPWEFEIRQGYHHGGTKLPGCADHRGDPENDEEGGGAGGERNPGSWSGRKFGSSRDGLYNETDGADIPINIQVYDATYDPTKHAHGWHHCWSKGVNKGSWYTIDYRLILNTPGENDGRILGWVNGEEAFDSNELAEEDGEFDGYQFLEERFSDRGIYEWRWHFYFGGGWGSPRDQSLYIRRFGLWVDDNCPEM